jgi:hypothetical protein
LCDPISAIALAGSAIAAGVNYEGQQQTMAAQQSANDQWVAYQQAASAKELAQDTALRQQATATMNNTLQQVSPASQAANQQAAASNLNAAMMAGNPAAPDSNVAVLGQGAGSGAPTSVTSDMAQRVTAAAREAQGRIAALAGVTSYGSGYNDMGEQANAAITAGNQAINLTSDMRAGDVAALKVAQNVQPVQYVQGSNLAGTIATQLANAAGSRLATSLKGMNLGGSAFAAPT